MSYATIIAVLVASAICAVIRSKEENNKIIDKKIYLILVVLNGVILILLLCKWNIYTITYIIGIAAIELLILTMDIYEAINPGTLSCTLAFISYVIARGIYAFNMEEDMEVLHQEYQVKVIQEDYYYDTGDGRWEQIPESIKIYPVQEGDEERLEKITKTLYIIDNNKPERPRSKEGTEVVYKLYINM